MFDNINKQNNPPAGGIKSAGAPVFPARGETEDIFAATDSLVESLNKGKEKPAAFEPKQMPGAGLGLREKLSDFGSDNKKYFMLGLIVLVAAVFIGGGIWGIGKYGPMLKNSGNEAGKAADVATVNDTVNNSETAADNSSSNQPADQAPVEQPEAAPQPVDTDGDGLTDEEEKTLGINSENIDSDNDGLFDREEVKVYKTNPLNPDTDDDGYLDGAEVKGGYNPNGPGNLYEIK